MHYTVGNFPAVLKLFTADLSDGRASAHYMITQGEQDRKIQGGIPFQIVPEDKRSWHAGVSFWRGVKNLNATSIGIENPIDTRDMLWAWGLEAKCQQK